MPRPVLQKPKINNLVRIWFYDHAENHHEPIRCSAIGQVTDISRLAYTIETWTPLGDAITDSERDANTNKFCIIRSTIYHLEILHHSHE